MKKILLIPFVALILSFAVSGCYVGRPYDPYYNGRAYKYKYKRYHHHDRDDRYRNRDRDDYGYRNRY